MSRPFAEPAFVCVIRAADSLLAERKRLVWARKSSFETSAVIKLVLSL